MDALTRKIRNVNEKDHLTHSARLRARGRTSDLRKFNFDRIEQFDLKVSNTLFVDTKLAGGCLEREFWVLLQNEPLQEVETTRIVEGPIPNSLKSEDQGLSAFRFC